jgi:hypothetical protein
VDANTRRGQRPIISRSRLQQDCLQHGQSQPRSCGHCGR